MTLRQFLKTSGAAIAVVVLAGMLISATRGKADGDNSESRIEQGFDIAPVPLDLHGKNRALVGLGSYLVNGPGDWKPILWAAEEDQYGDVLGRR